MTFIPVTDINCPILQDTVGGSPYPQAPYQEEAKLETTVVPSDATNQIINWSVLSGNASIYQKSDGHYIKAHQAGTVKIRATIIDGVQQ